MKRTKPVRRTNPLKIKDLADSLPVKNEKLAGVTGGNFWKWMNHALGGGGKSHCGTPVNDQQTD